MKPPHLTTRRLGLGLALLALLAAPALGWGHTGHYMINKLAVDALPEGALKAYFKENRDYLADHAIDADNAKTGDPLERRRHYLDIDTDGIRPETYPRSWKAAVARFGEDTATKQGTLPWSMQTKLEELVSAMKERDASKILERAAWLGHYVGDAHVPFHACSNNNGQLTGQKGIHAIWESHMLDHNKDEIEPAVVKLVAKMQVAEVNGEISDWCFDRLMTGDSYAHQILEKDKGNRAAGREKNLWETTGEIAEKRLAEATTGLASLWLTAYNRAGKPVLPNGKAPEKPPEPPPVQPQNPPKGPVGGMPPDRGDEDPGVAPPRPEKPDPPKPEPKPEPPKPEPKPEPEPAPSAKATDGGIKGLLVHDDDNQPGAIVDVPGDACAAANIHRGDVIISVDGNHVNSVGTLKRRLQDYKAGDSVPLGILRKGAEELHTVRIP
ncbi:PDZ domain-containing protein [bacterium]|nr:PDZ domain-containing protein [bacterium]